MPTALVTNATGFGGPAAVAALLIAGYQVFAHDAAFADHDIWQGFSENKAGLVPFSQSAPEEVVEAAFGAGKRLDAIISNDHVPAPAHLPENAPLESLHHNLSGLVEFPFRLIKAAIPHFRNQNGGNVVMITSNRMKLPISGGAFPDAARAAANALVRSLAIDLARDKITVNAISPNFLYSEAYYPAAYYKNTKEGRNWITEKVPTGQLADPQEMGELIVFLAGAKSRHLTGAVIDFSGGWPAGAARPVT